MYEWRLASTSLGRVWREVLFCAARHHGRSLLRAQLEHGEQEVYNAGAGISGNALTRFGRFRAPSGTLV
eukprot:10106402-Alexandrium_andersonii.AAC.1